MMNNHFTKWKNGLLIGVIVAALEGLLIWAADPNTQPWVFIQSASFWLFCGLVVYMTDTGLPTIINGIVLTIVLNIPWYIALAIVPGNYAYLLPLIIVSAIFGGIIGFMSRKLEIKSAKARPSSS